MDWSGRSRGGGFGHRFFVCLIRLAGLRVSYLFLAIVVPYFVFFSSKATRSIYFYYRAILRKGRVQAFFSIFPHYYRFGQTLIDKVALRSGMSERFGFRFEDYEQVLKILDGERGVITIGAHIGSWEAGSAFFGRYADRMNIVLYDGETEAVKRAVKGAGSDVGYSVIRVNADGIENVIKIKSALARGEIVCFQGDRYINREGTLTASFMGRAAKFPAGPFITASRLGVPVIFYYSVREKGRGYRFIFRVVEEQARRAGIPPQQALLDRYIEATEAVLREYPRQWFNFYRFWS